MMQVTTQTQALSTEHMLCYGWGTRILVRFCLAVGLCVSHAFGGYAQTAVKFDNAWSSAYHVDPRYRHHFVNDEGKHLYVLNKTAWAYFACKDPQGVLNKAREQGVNVLRVALEGTPYKNVLHMDMWPWGGTREKPDWTRFNEAYWREVEARIRLAGEQGIGFDIVLYFTMHPEVGDVKSQTRYWKEVIRRLGKFSNVLVWEVANEYIANESFQDAAGSYFKLHDPYRRAVCSSDGTTEDALWPYKDWMDLALVHTCTGNQGQYDLEYWYLNVARNTRQYAKPAFNNETGREVRHKNDDPISRRKQAWLWTASGAYWTWHSWEGCEGIDDRSYYGPGWEYLRPMADYFRSLPFWKMEPNYTIASLRNSGLVFTALATPEREISIFYCCTRESGMSVAAQKCYGRIRDGHYIIRFLDPATMKPVGTTTLDSPGLRAEFELTLPSFKDDLLVEFTISKKEDKSLIEGTK